VTAPRGSKAPRIPMSRDRSLEPPNRPSPTQPSIRSPFNPDPLHVDEVAASSAHWIGRQRSDLDAAFEAGMAAAAHARPIWRRIVAVVLAAFVAGLLIGRLIVPVQAAAPRPAQTTTPQPGASGAIGSFDASAQATASTSSGLIGAPRDGMPVESARTTPAVVVAAPAASVGAPQPTEPPAIASGLASWYDDGPGLYAAVPSWRFGDRPYQVTVSAGGRSVVVTVRDFCGCPGARIIDLSPEAFAELAPLSRGLVVVTVEEGRPGATPPATDVQP
jgi:hypothetical protein